MLERLAPDHELSRIETRTSERSSGFGSPFRGAHDRELRGCGWIKGDSAHRAEDRSRTRGLLGRVEPHREPIILPEHRLRLAFRDDPAGLQDGDALAELLHLGEDVAREEVRDAVLREL